MDQLYLSLEHKNTISTQVIRLAESLVLSAWSASAETLQEQQKYSHIQIRPSFSHTQSWKQGNIKSWLKDSRSLFNLFFFTFKPEERGGWCIAIQVCSSAVPWKSTFDAKEVGGCPSNASFGLDYAHELVDIDQKYETLWILGSRKCKKNVEKVAWKMRFGKGFA